MKREDHAALPLQLAGEEVLLLAQRALYWPREKMLVVADIHFGKAASFRKLGVPVPGGTTSANVAALDALIAACDVRHIMFLGDFLHAKAAHRLTVVRGNHDAHAGDPPAALDIAMVDEPHVLAPFAFCHHPDMLVPSYVLAGHVHPLYRLRRGWELLTLPCFLIGDTRMVLPSFGAFTGGHAIRPAAGERLFLVAGDMVLAHAKLTLGR
jgi:metallophosphoesterase superfamily enzyme